MKKQTMDQEFKARLAISLITAGYYNSPLAKAIVAIDSQIKSIPADKAGKMLFNITFDQQQLPVGQFDFLDSFIRNVVPSCRDVTVLKSMLEQLADAFMRIHADDDFVQLEYLVLLGEVRAIKSYPKTVSLLLGSLQQPERPINPRQFESIVALLDATPFTWLPHTLKILSDQFLQHGVNMTTAEITAVLQLLAKHVLQDLKKYRKLENMARKHSQSDSNAGAASEIGAGTPVNPHTHQPPTDSGTAFPVPGQGDETVATSCVSKPTRQIQEPQFSLADGNILDDTAVFIDDPKHWQSSSVKLPNVTRDHSKHADNENVHAQRPIASDRPTRQTTIDLSASNFAFDYMDRLTDAIARGHKPSNIGIAAVAVKQMTSVVPSLRAIEVLLGNAFYQTFDDARSKKEESLYNRFVNADFANDVDELVAEIVLFAPMMFSPNRFIERLACLELHTNGAKYLR